MWEAVIAIQCQQLAAFEERLYQESRAKASPEVAAAMDLDREKKRKEQTEERRHQEIVEALRKRTNQSESYYQQNTPTSPPQSGIIPFVLGWLFGKSL